MTFTSECNKDHRCFGTKLENGEVIQDEDLFFREHYSFGTKSVKSGIDFISVKAFFLREQHHFGKKSKKSESDFKWKLYFF